MRAEKLGTQRTQSATEDTEKSRKECRPLAYGPQLPFRSSLCPPRISVSSAFRFARSQERR